jgi:quercetin dioxygenase-like cupin family protein
MKQLVIALGALLAALQAVGQTQANASVREMRIVRARTQQAVNGPAQNFTGAVRVDPLFAANAPSRTSGAYVTCEPGARSAWHNHPMGQTLVVTAGTGRVQSWGSPVQEIRAGDVVWTPPGMRHWHGAAPGSAMTHMAIQDHVEGKVVEWMEQVTNAEYNSANKED